MTAKIVGVFTAREGATSREINEKPFVTAGVISLVDQFDAIPPALRWRVLKSFMMTVLASHEDPEAALRLLVNRLEENLPIFVAQVKAAREACENDN